MKSVEFISVRNRLDMSQSSLASLLATSSRSVQAYEQGWRVIPAHIERLLLYLLYQKIMGSAAARPCWETKNCPDSWRELCPAWHYRAKGPCWFFNGNFCEGRNAASWNEKMETCRSCHVFTCVMGSGENE